ncbi:solute carrier organic anion transporter family member 2B1 isoform X2 [Microcaecilia unicolor]|uniref:Solute carrier organic anion transporter family member n=1 Tax=Microcaecilia unicolor TaxID=1415580 RepID=A0A6P7XTM0_9AMPH|nr:solute carrier organic anion transporter family member 2B1 isoform X2 [Microcaecilia unicolor]
MDRLHQRKRITAIWQRKWRNLFLSIKFFVVCHAFLQLAQLLVSGYLKGSISTIEKRFGLSSQTSGLIASFNEFGNTALIVFVSYVGSRVHRPRVIGCGALLVCAAGLLMSLPHFVVGKYEYDKSYSSGSSNKTDICQPTETNKSHDKVCSKSTVQGTTTACAILFIGQTILGIGGVPIQPFGISYIDDFAAKHNSPLYLGILFAVTVLGPGVAFVLGSAMLRYYVDIDKMKSEDVLLKPSDPHWVGAWWMGFLVASFLVLISSIPYFFFPKEMHKEPQVQRTLVLEAAGPADPEKRAEDTALLPEKQRTDPASSFSQQPFKKGARRPTPIFPQLPSKGARVADAEASSPLPPLPQNKVAQTNKLDGSHLLSPELLLPLPTVKRESQGSILRQRSDVTIRLKESRTGRDLQGEVKSRQDLENLSLAELIKTFPQVLFRNIRQPVCVLIVLGQLSLTCMVTGLATFMAKFLERQFTITASIANLIIGAVNIPGAMIGIVAGGVIMRRFRMSLKECSALCTVGLFIALICNFPLIFLGCSTQDFKSPNITYKNGRTDKYNLSACYKNCNCPDMAYNPICGSDGFEYMSPCYAGCKSFSINPAERTVQNYTQCSCIRNPDQTEGFAQPGKCGSQCYQHYLLPFVTLSLLSGILASTSHTPSFMIILRTVRPEDKSIAVGLQFMILRALAWLPGPVFYGTVIDSTCLVWKKICGKKKSCLYYDNDLFRYRYIGLQFVFQVIAFFCYLAVFLIFQREEKKTAHFLGEASASTKEKMIEEPKAQPKGEPTDVPKAQPKAEPNTEPKIKTEAQRKSVIKL